MSSSMEMTEEQLGYWRRENHNNGKPSLAILYPDGEIEMDYPSEIILRFSRREAEALSLDEAREKAADQIRRELVRGV